MQLFETASTLNRRVTLLSMRCLKVELSDFPDPSKKIQKTRNKQVTFPTGVQLTYKLNTVNNPVIKRTLEPVDFD